MSQAKQNSISKKLKISLYSNQYDIASYILTTNFLKNCKFLKRFRICCHHYSAYHHRRTGRHFTGGAEKFCPENNNLP